jgi:hypothetical protein
MFSTVALATGKYRQSAEETLTMAQSKGLRRFSQALEGAGTDLHIEVCRQQFTCD